MLPCRYINDADVSDGVHQVSLTDMGAWSSTNTGYSLYAATVGDTASIALDDLTPVIDASWSTYEQTYPGEFGVQTDASSPAETQCASWTPPPVPVYEEEYLYCFGLRLTPGGLLCLCTAVSGLHVYVSIRNTGYAMLSNVTLEGWPGLADALSCYTWCPGVGIQMPYQCSITLRSARITRYGQNVWCEGTYLYTEDESFSGNQTRNVTVAGISPLGKRVTTTRSVYMSPIAPKPSVYINLEWDSMSYSGCNVDMQGKL